MSFTSILLGLDGSAQSRYAAEVSWMMAKSGGLRVDGQHIVDSLAAWDFLAFDIAGFIGSGPYFAAHETMRNSLFTIGQNLTEVYKSLADANGIEGEVFLDEGTTIKELCWRAQDHDLVVLGHRSTGMQSPDEDKRKIPRRSVGETLTHYCPKPLLIVQDRCRMWDSMRIMLSTNQIPSSLLESCVNFANQLGITPTVRYLFSVDAQNEGATDVTMPNGQRVMDDLKKLVPQLKDAQIDIRTTTDIDNYWKKDAEEDSETLLVVPVVEMAGQRKTAFGSSPDLMVRYLNHPAILFWMQEQPAETKAEKGGSVSTAAQK